MANDLEYSLGLDVTPMQRASASISKFGDDTVKALNRKFSGADLFRGILQGIGIASVGAIAEKLTAPFKESAESAQRIAEWSDKAADATLRLIGLRQTDAQQLASLEKQYARIAAEAEKPVTRGFWSRMAGFAVDPLNLTGGWASGLVDDSKDKAAEKGAQAAAELAQKALEIQLKKDAMRRKAEEEEMRALKAMYSEEEKRAAAIQKLAGFEREERLSKLSAEQKVVELEKERRATAQEIAELEKFTREGGTLTAEGVTHLLGLKEQQRDIEQDIADITSRKAKAEEQIGATIESNIAKWEEFKGIIESVGRGDSELTERELQRKIDTINADLANRQNQRTGAYLGAAGTGNYDLIGESLRGSLAQLLAEQRLREETRRNNAIFGPDRAFQMFGGTEQRFAEIISGQRDEFHRLNDGLEVLNRQLQQGVRTAVFTEGAT